MAKAGRGQMLNGTLFDGTCVKLNLSITDCNQCK